MNDLWLKRLTKRQMDIAEYAKKGFSDKEIANALDISIYTVKTHLKNIYEKIEVSGRTELAGLSDWYASDIPDTKSILGHWLSRFEYKAYRPGLNDYIIGIQYNLEFLFESEESDFFPICGKNKLGTGDSELSYSHDLKCHFEKNNLLGVWINNSSTRNMGCFQLNISNNNFIMSGKHIGNASNNSIQSGDWIWIKVKDSSLNKRVGLGGEKNINLIDFEKLESKFRGLLAKSAVVDPEDILRTSQG